MFCLDAEMLYGRSLLRSFGRRFLSLDPNSVAALASLSAASFPMDSMWPATHVSENETGLLVRRVCLLFRRWRCEVAIPLLLNGCSGERQSPQLQPVQCTWSPVSMRGTIPARWASITAPAVSGRGGS